MTADLRVKATGEDVEWVASTSDTICVRFPDGRVENFTPGAIEWTEEEVKS